MQQEKQLVLFSSSDGDVVIDVKLNEDTVWLTQKQIEILFGRDQSVISRHVKNIFLDELDKESNMQILTNLLFFIILMLLSL